ncbi:MAG TPA: HAMP domain-containing sensor histidine kinase [Lentimicrobium sp.]|mgnify:CR=1 FL=1|jgi:signal transduction histidine kinase|nr:HAMP domain-containing sensor histidine kinase [Lentimicrobium sp.]
MNLSKLMRPRVTNIYEQKKAWKRWLFLVALLIVGFSLWYTNLMIKNIARDERNKITTWANAIQQQVNLVNYTDDFFDQIRVEERKRVEILAEATERLAESGDNENILFYLSIISKNTSIPVVLADEKGRIMEARNVDFSPDTVRQFTPELMEEFSVYPPLKLDYYSGNYVYFYYKDSRLFSELKVVLDDLVESFFNEVVNNSASVPVIITDSTRTSLVAWGMIDSTRVADTLFIRQTIEEMSASNDPIEIVIADRKHFIYYKDSFLLTQLRYFPIVQLAIIGIFLLVSYLLFSTARRSEQNQVWVGLAKETAHQLGTPLSSMMAWVEYLKTKDIGEDTIEELEKDVNRLNTIAERFSKIGSAASLKTENLVDVVYNAVAYLKTRTSNKVVFQLSPARGSVILIPMNYQLFDWVIENLVKNAVDAMSGQGQISIEMTEEDRLVHIDITDTGKGISRKKFRTIFNPGYTSKQRGWGLGLSLSQRIIREIHNGRIFVKASAPGKGTTFRITLIK